MENKIFDLLEAAAVKRESLKSCTNAMRLCNGYGDGLDGLILDQYNRHFVMQIFDKRWMQEKKVLMAFLKKHFDAQYLIIKDRSESLASHPDAFKTTVWIDHESPQTVVEENGLKFSVDLDDTLNSGLFLDMRYNRKVVSELSAGRKVLNCFAYTCSFGVYCRAAKAASVVNVDVSKKSLRRGQTNYGLNQLFPEKNEFIYSDAVKYLDRAVEKNNKFDLIILDPPSFARHEGKSFSVKKDLINVIDLSLLALNPEGILFVATNFSGFVHEDLEDMLAEVEPKSGIKSVRRMGQDIDFAGSGYMPESYLAALLVQL